MEIRKEKDRERRLLHGAIEREDGELLEFLLDKGADIEARTHLLQAEPGEPGNHDNTPLHHAGYIGRADIVRVLLEKGADVNARNGARETPLHLACAHGYKEAARSLLKAGADVNARDIAGWTPLHAASAASRGNDMRIEKMKDNVVQLLLSYRADPTAQDNIGNTPAHVAAASGRGFALRDLELSPFANVSLRNEKHQTARDVLNGVSGKSLNLGIPEHVDGAALAAAAEAEKPRCLEEERQWQMRIRAGKPRAQEPERPAGGQEQGGEEQESWTTFRTRPGL